ncbi:MAG: nucleoside 2-deoxyribosyltransferase [Terracidiphilus sp.]
MKPARPIPLLVGEVFVDFTLTEPGKENKLRLGGVAHAARGFWALDAPYGAAVVLPRYLEEIARRYFEAFGCVDFRVLGEVKGAPNVTVILDAIEVADQEYDTLLRDEKTVELSGLDLSNESFGDILVFPGSFGLVKVCKSLPSTSRLHVDVAYDVDTPDALAELPQAVETILISTSSPLFRSIADTSPQGLAKSFEACAPATLILKENRGGARMFLTKNKSTESLPSQLGATVNSVGVGDVFAAAYVANFERGCIEAGWRATYAAAAYSQTTYPDLFKTYVHRDLNLTLEEMRDLGGVLLPWEKRRECPIYLAAPDFSYGDRRAIDKAIASLRYHNFVVRRPVVENGELPADSAPTALQDTFQGDYELLKQCVLLFAVPTGRDPGALVELGLAIEAGLPAVVYDPAGENANTMVMAGARHYSRDLDSCLNAVFEILSGAEQQ